MIQLSKDKLIFDPADAADSDNAGAYLRAGSDGDLLSSTNVGGKEALDVNVANTISISATDLDIRDLTHVSDSVKVGDGTDFLAINGDGSLNAVVSATDLDIRDLTHVSDSVKIGDGTDFLAINGDGSLNATVSATNLDIRDLTHVSDSVKVGDGTDFLAVNADGSINVNLTDDSVADDAADTGNPFKVGGVAYSTASALAAVSAGDRVNLAMDLYRRVIVSDTANVAQALNKRTVGTTEVAIAASPLAGRTRVFIQNISNNPVYIGPTGVTVSGSTQGISIAKGASLSLEISAAIAMFLIAGTAGNDVLVWEFA
jgi:hypothetical protein